MIFALNFLIAFLFLLVSSWKTWFKQQTYLVVIVRSQ